MPRRFTAFLLWVFFLSPLDARQEPVLCGAHHEKLREELFLHQQSVKGWRSKLRSGKAARLAPAASQIGNIAILEDSDGVVERRNVFNLDKKSIRFRPSAADASRYRFEVEANTYDREAAAKGTLLTGLGDDDSRLLPLPFPFPFFGATHRQVYVNSDGNLTFTAGDSSSSERSLGRLTSGPPRIAGLFRDLDPSVSSDGVRVLAEPSRFVVTWVSVPEYQEVGVGVPQTFQIEISPDGGIRFAYADVRSQEAVVGITPGRLQGSTSLVSFLDGSPLEYSATVAERFSGTQGIDTVRAAQKFYETHEDAYDYLVFFNALGIEAGPTAVAFEVTVRGDRGGIGDPVHNVGEQYGSRRRLQAVLNMGPLNQYPEDPYAVVPRRSFAGDTPMSVIGHEAGHLFLAFASTRDPDNPRARPLLCADLAHWSFVFNSEASLVSGNRVQDDGPGASPRFRTVASVESFSPLDQYLMGLRAPEEVPPSFLVRRATVSASSCLPRPGVTFNGERQDVSVEDIIAAEGPRTPRHQVAQKRFSFAFILIVAQGTDPSTHAARLENYRREFESFFHRSASERAWADTSLRRSLTLSLFPAGGVIAGASAPASLAIEKPAPAALTVRLRGTNGYAAVPETVTIPAGALRAEFTVRGLRPGVEELWADPVNTEYQPAHAYVRVAPSLATVKLSAVSGDLQLAVPGAPLPQPVELRAVDEDKTPYAGLRVTASVSAGGAVTPAAATTDENGLARFVWTPGPGPLNELTAALEGGTPSARVTVTALGPPSTTAAAVANSASFAPGLSPGALASIFGANLAGGAAGRSDVKVTLNGLPATILYASERQLNILVPRDLPAGEAELVVATAVGRSAPVRVPVFEVQPGLFHDPASRLGAVQILSAPQGEVLVIYGTGFGPVRTPGGTDLQETVLAPEVYLAGRPCEVLFSGLSPGSPGLYQINARVPASVPRGESTLRVVVAGQSSNQVRVILP